MFEIRPIPDSDIDRMMELAELAFHVRTEEEFVTRNRWFLGRCGRLGAYEGERLVGQLGWLSMPLRIPGGELPGSMITYVAVAPTHRRRGVLSALVDGLWRSCDHPVSGLWAAEAAIYGRYGYGAASHQTHIELDVRAPLAFRVEPDPAPSRLVDLDEALTLLPPLYERARLHRPGQLGRDEDWWRNAVLVGKLEDEPEWGPPATRSTARTGPTTATRRCSCASWSRSRRRPRRRCGATWPASTWSTASAAHARSTTGSSCCSPTRTA